MVKKFSEFAKETKPETEAPADELKEFAPVPDDQIPAIFATIHHKSDERPDGYAPEDISWLNVIANRHLPELYAQLLAAHKEAFPDHHPDDLEDEV